MPHTSDAIKILNIDHPIIQGPFGGGFSTVELTAAVSNRGGLGSFGVEHLDADGIIEVASNIRKLTNRSFNLNLWVSKHDAGGNAPSPRDLDRYWQVFKPYYDELGLERPEFTPEARVSFEDQLDALFAARPHVFSFVFGIPTPAVLAECRRLGIVTLGAATSVAEAEALEDAGVDLILTTGTEAGGHRVSFLGRAEDELMGTFALTQLVARRVSVPVIAAGGIADAGGVRAARALGAQAVQVGTAFLACEQSGISDLHRQLLFSPLAHDTALSRAFTGRLARGMRNRWLDDMADRVSELAPFPIQGWFFSRIKEAAVKDGRADLSALYGGQIAPNLRHRQADAVMDDLIAGTA